MINNNNVISYVFARGEMNSLNSVDAELQDQQSKLF